MNAKPKILLVWPIFQAMYPRPFHAFAEILIAAGRQTEYQFGICVMERSSLVTIMNDIGQRMVHDGWEACIVFDDDCFPPFDVVPRLLTRCFDEGLPFVAAAGIMRNYPFTTTAARTFPEGVTCMVNEHGKFDHLAGFQWIDDLPEELTPVDFCGVPAAIIHKRVFQAIAPPWFGDVGEDGRRVTHDVYFCNKVKAAGFPIYVDGTIRCGHLIDAPIVTFENRASARASVTPVPSKESTYGA